MLFRDNDEGKDSLWRQFLASIDHISLHIALSNFACYSKFARDKDEKLAIFAISIVEDAIIEAYNSRIWPNMLAIQAYACTLAYLRLKKPVDILNESMRIQNALLMKLTTGEIDEYLSEEMKKTVENVARRISVLKANTHILEMRIKQDNDQTAKVDELKLDVVEKIYSDLEKYGEPPEVAALPHQEHYGDCHITNRISQRIHQEEFEMLFGQIYKNLGGKTPDLKSVIRESVGNMRADQIFSKLESMNITKQLVMKKYNDLIKDTHFRSMGYPPEDIGRYQHFRDMMTGPIRRMTDYIRQVKNLEDEQFRMEGGTIDMPEAIQVIASQSKRNDIFITEEPLIKSEGWNIMIDLSSSTEVVLDETKKYGAALAEVAAISLSEAAAGLSSDDAWGMYGFSNDFYILKDFEENYSSMVKARIGGLKSGGLTYLPDAIIMGTRMIRESSMAERNFLVVVTDGLPAGYEGIEADLEEAIIFAQKKGVLTLGMGLDSKRIKRYFDHYCVISNVKDLMKSFIGAYMELGS
jgi:hypothetical protein